MVGTHVGDVVGILVTVTTVRDSPPSAAIEGPKTASGTPTPTPIKITHNNARPIQ